MSDRHATVRDLFLAALEHDPEERPAFLEGCGEDLRREVESLLAHHEAPPETVPAGALGASDPGRAGGSRPGLARPDAGRRNGARFEAGEVFAGRYRIVSELGRGGMGEVYRAHDLVLDEPVALKFLPRHRRRHLDRLLNEVRMARQVSHPNVCRVYDFGEAEGEIFLTMEYIDGENLAALLQRIGRFSQDKLFDVAHQLCAGLAAAHARGVLHRDLKPANIMIDGRGRAKITDFGIAASAPTGSGEAAIGDGLIVGTPAYMAPEQLEAGRTSVKSDLYALGLVLHEMATGEQVFSSPTPAGYAELHKSATPAPPSQRVSHLEPRLEAAILHCLEKGPEDRPASARAVALALPGADRLQLALEAGETPSPEAVAAAGAGEALAPAVSAALLGLLMLILTGVLVLSDRAYPAREAWAASPPAVLVDRAAGILESLGYGGTEAATEGAATAQRGDGEARPARAPRRDRGDRAWGFYPAEDGLGDEDVELFWYRRSPSPMIPSELWAIVYPRVDSVDPPLLEPGMIRLLLDPAGRLVELRAVPGEDDGDADGDRELGGDGEPAATFDWQPLLAAGGLAGEELASAEPGRRTARKLPPVFADRRAAWTTGGSTAGRRVEAAVQGGRPVFFEVRSEAAEPPEEPAFDWDRLWDWYLIGEQLAWFLLALGAIVLARINLRAGRGDLAGARRLAVFVVVMNAASWVLEIDYLPPWGELLRWQLTFGWILLEALVAWLAYIALEPVVRRWWPRALIAWSRLLRGRPRDPLVGHSLLIGALVGSLWALLTALDRLATAALGLDPAPEIFMLVQLETALSGRLAFAEILSSGIEAVFRGVLDLFFLVALRVVLRRWWLAVSVFVVAYGVLETLQGIHPAVSWLTLGLGITGVTAFVLVRFGLLTYVTALFCYLVLIAAPVSLDLTAWYAETGFFILALVAGLGAFGAWTALAGRQFPATLAGFETDSRP